MRGIVLIIFGAILANIGMSIVPMSKETTELSQVVLAIKGCTVAGVGMFSMVLGAYDLIGKGKEK